jgi:hypothetical protein
VNKLRFCVHHVELDSAHERTKCLNFLPSLEACFVGTRMCRSAGVQHEIAQPLELVKVNVHFTVQVDVQASAKVVVLRQTLSLSFS